MSNPQIREYPAQWDFMILLLAIAGGSVDGVMIIAFNVLTGAQTGNTVLLGAALAQGRLPTAFGSMVSVVGYVLGAAGGEFILIRHHETWPWPSAAGTVLIAELIPLCCLFIFWRLAGPHPVQETICILIICAAGAMGLQSTAMLLLHGGPSTTYVTGTLTVFATKLIQWLKLVDAASVSAPGRQRLSVITAFSAVGRPWIYGLTWFVYLTGTVVGSLLYLYSREMALLLPFIAIIAVIIAARHDRIDMQALTIELKDGQNAKATAPPTNQTRTQ